MKLNSVLGDPAIERWTKSWIQNRVDLMTSARSRPFSLWIYRANNVIYGAVCHHRHAERFTRLLRIRRRVLEANIFFKASLREYHFARKPQREQRRNRKRLSIRITIYRRQFRFRGISKTARITANLEFFARWEWWSGMTRSADFSNVALGSNIFRIPTIIPLLEISLQIFLGFLTSSLYR